MSVSLGYLFLHRVYLPSSPPVVCLWEGWGGGHQRRLPLRRGGQGVPSRWRGGGRWSWWPATQSPPSSLRCRASTARAAAGLPAAPPPTVADALVPCSRLSFSCMRATSCPPGLSRLPRPPMFPRSVPTVQSARERCGCSDRAPDTRTAACRQASSGRSPPPARPPLASECPTGGRCDGRSHGGGASGRLQARKRPRNRVGDWNTRHARNRYP